MQNVRAITLPSYPDTGCVYTLIPELGSICVYPKRTDRNIGYIQQQEQDYLRTCTVGIAGCGGMGGLLASTMLRLGIGEIRIADPETFDVSNINRQMAAKRSTIGVNKAFATAHELRTIANDTTVVIYPTGITEETVEDFMNGCDVIIDLIEFWAIGSRILLHKKAREQKIPLINCNTVGHASFLWRFTHDGMHLEDMLDIQYDEGKKLQTLIANETAKKEEILKVMEAILKVFVPMEREYSKNPDVYSTVGILRKRLLEEKKASIIATNPAMACGFASNHILFELLRDSSFHRNVIYPPVMPGYLMVDAGHMIARKHEGIWWT